MSRRRESYSPYRPPYLRMVEPEESMGWRLWLGAALSLVVTVVVCLFVAAAWTVGRRLLAAGV